MHLYVILILYWYFTIYPFVVYYTFSVIFRIICTASLTSFHRFITHYFCFFNFTLKSYLYFFSNNSFTFVFDALLHFCGNFLFLCFSASTFLCYFICFSRLSFTFLWMVLLCSFSERYLPSFADLITTFHWIFLLFLQLH